MHQIKLRKGFTFIELCLSILITSVLIITIALTTNAITSIATKGLSLRSVNALGNDLASEFSRSIASSTAADFSTMCETIYTGDGSPDNPTACYQDSAYNYIFRERVGIVKISGDPDSTAHANTQLSGLFCTGYYTYIWNTGYALSDGVYTGTGGTSLTPSQVKLVDTTISDFRLLRFIDPLREICANYVTSSYGQEPITPIYDLSTIDQRLKDINGGTTGLVYEELIPKVEQDFAIYNIYVAKPAQDSTTSHTFYSGSFVLATLRGGVNIFSTGDYCKLDGETADFDYCAVNKFNFAATAQGN